MATIYIRDESGKEFLAKELKIGTGQIVTQEMLEGVPEEGEFGYEQIQNDIDLDNININSAPGMMLSSTVINAISQYIEATVQSLVAGKSIELLNQLGINQENLELTDKILGIVDSAVFKINSILKMVPKNIKTLPEGQTFMSSLTTSLKDMYMAIWINLEHEYNITINEAILNMPSAIEALHDAQEALLNLAENLINDQVYRYTGKTLPELLYICRNLISKYNEYKEKLKLARQGVDIKSVSHIELNYEQIKSELLQQLNTCSDMMYNAFMILKFKDAINDIRLLINQFHCIDLNCLTENINSFDDFMQLMQELGVNEKSSVITLKEAIESGINTIQNQFNSLSAQFTAQLLGSGAQLLATTAHNTSVYSEQKAIYNYHFDFDLNTKTISIIFEKEPSTKHIRKNLQSLLSTVKDDEDKLLFIQNDVKQIFEAIDKGMYELKDQELKVSQFNIKLIFNLPNYNIERKQTEQLAKLKEQTEKMEQEQEAAKKKAESEAILSSLNSTYQIYKNYQEVQEEKVRQLERTIQLKKVQEESEKEITAQFELGVVTEEYSGDPTYLSRRPTIQLVHELYGILEEVLPLLKIVGTLVSNYQINKAKVQNNAKGNLFGMVRFLAKVNKLLQEINTDNKNFYTVRTLKLYDYITNNIKQQETINTEIELNNEETKVLYNYLMQNNLKYNEINEDLDTLLYIDIDAINMQKNEFAKEFNKAEQYFGTDTSLFVDYPDTSYVDGTITGIDKIQQAENIIYYSNSSLPIIGSQIMRCYKNNYDVSI